MQNNYLLECSDSLSIQKKEEELIKLNNFENQYKAIYDLEETTLTKALEDLDTYSFLSQKKIIIIRNAFINITDKETKHLLKYIENPIADNLLIITSHKLDSRMNIVKSLKKNKNVEYIKIEMNPKKFVEEKLKDYKISSFLINYLIDLCKEDVTKLDNECEKLKNYKLNNKEITKEDIDLLVVEKLGDSSESLYSMANAIIRKDKKQALKDYQILKQYQMDAYSIIGLLASQIKLIHQVKILKEKNMSNQEIADTLEVKSVYQIKKMAEYSSIYTYQDIFNLTHLLAETDLKIKTGKIDPDIAIDMLIISEKN